MLWGSVSEKKEYVIKMTLRKVEGFEKVWRYPPTLTVSYPPPYNDVQVLLRSEKYLEPPDEDGNCLVSYIQGYKRGTLLDTAYLFDSVKTLIHQATEIYYNSLRDAEIYELPENFKNDKRLDTVILVDTIQS